MDLETKEYYIAFLKGIKQLVNYKKEVSWSEFRSAAYEAYENIEEEEINYLKAQGIETFSDFLVYLKGVDKGLEIFSLTLK